MPHLNDSGVNNYMFLTLSDTLIVLWVGVLSWEIKMKLLLIKYMKKDKIYGSVFVKYFAFQVIMTVSIFGVLLLCLEN